VPIMAAMVVVASRRKLMGKFVASARIRILGWCATGVMAAATVAMLVV
jgi:Mn2+/Fe2+ NRAMP family transporter